MEKNCLQCGNAFNAQLDRAKFCSGKCRAKYSNLHPKANLGEIDKLPKLPPPIEPKEHKLNTNVPGIDVRAQFVIDSLKDQKADLKEEVKKLRDQNAELLKKVDEQKETIRTMETDQKMAALSGPPPKGALEGILENDTLMQFLGPALSKLAERAVDLVPMPALNTPATQMAGVDQTHPGFAFIQWLSTQSEMVQKSILEMLQALSSVPSENEILSTVGTIERLVLGDYMRKAV